MYHIWSLLPPQRWLKRKWKRWVQMKVLQKQKLGCSCQFSAINTTQKFFEKKCIVDILGDTTICGKVWSWNPIFSWWNASIARARWWWSIYQINSSWCSNEWPIHQSLVFQNKNQSNKNLVMQHLLCWKNLFGWRQLMQSSSVKYNKLVEWNDRNGLEKGNPRF